MRRKSKDMKESSPKRKRRSNRNSRKRTASRKKKPNKWIQSVMMARKEMGVEGMQLLKKGSPLYKLARKIYDGDEGKVSVKRRSSSRKRS